MEVTCSSLLLKHMQMHLSTRSYDSFSSLGASVVTQVVGPDQVGSSARWQRWTRGTSQFRRGPKCRFVVSFPFPLLVLRILLSQLRRLRRRQLRRVPVPAATAASVLLHRRAVAAAFSTSTWSIFTRTFESIDHTV